MSIMIYNGFDTILVNEEKGEKDRAKGPEDNPHKKDRYKLASAYKSHKRTLPEGKKGRRSQLRWGFCCTPAVDYGFHIRDSGQNDEISAAYTKSSAKIPEFPPGNSQKKLEKHTKVC